MKTDALTTAPTTTRAPPDKSLVYADKERASLNEDDIKNTEPIVSGKAPATAEARPQPVAASAGILSALPSGLGEPSSATAKIADSFDKDAGAVAGGRVIESAFLTSLHTPPSVNPHELVNADSFKLALRVSMAKALNIDKEAVGVAWVTVLDIQRSGVVAASSGPSSTTHIRRSLQHDSPTGKSGASLPSSPSPAQILLEVGYEIGASTVSEAEKLAELFSDASKRKAMAQMLHKHHAREFSKLEGTAGQIWLTTPPRMKGPPKVVNPEEEEVDEWWDPADTETEEASGSVGRRGGGRLCWGVASVMGGLGGWLLLVV